jgi:uncharacterized protein (TIGR03437 family)
VRLIVSIACIWSSVAAAQTVFPRGIVNAASFVAPGLPGGGIAQGSVFSIFGAGLGPSSSPPLTSFPLATTLGGVSIKVSQGGTSVSAIPLFVSPGQINAIMPSNAPLGLDSVQVTFNGKTGNSSPVRVAASSVGIFAVNQAGTGPVAAFNFISQASQPLNTNQAAAQPGQVVTIYGTGLGPAIGSDNTAPVVQNLPVNTQVSVGGQPASLLYYGRTSCCAGIDQVIFTVPTTVATGCWVPVFIQTNGAIVSNVVTIAIANSGANCFDGQNSSLQTFIKGGRAGAVVALRSSIHEDIGVRSTVDVTADYAGIIASSELGSATAFNPFLSHPPAGTCTVNTMAGDIFGNTIALPGSFSTGALLDTGSSFTLTGSSAPQQLNTLLKPLLNIGYVGSAITGFTPDPGLMLNPGQFKLSGPGGKDVPAFSSSFAMPAGVTWTNRDQLATFRRSQPLTLNFTGAADGQTISIIGGVADLPTNSSALFQCIAPSGATSFTVPAAILSTLPATRALPSQSKSVLFVGTLDTGGSASLITAGLDSAVMLPLVLTGRPVTVQ